MDDSTVKCFIAEKAVTTPDNVAVSDSEYELSYLVLHHAINQVAESLQEKGITKNDRVAILSTNSIESLLVFFAIIRLRASFVPVNLRWSEGSWKKIIHETNCKLILADPDHMDFVNMWGLDTNIKEMSGIGGFLNTDFTNKIEQNEIDIESEVAVNYTSGSSGTPKGVRLSYGNFYYNAIGSNQNIPLMPSDCWLASTPFYHVSGLAIPFRCFLAGATVFVINDLGTKSLQKCISDFNITHISVVPDQLQRLIEKKPAALLDLKCILVGGAPIPKKLIQKCLQLQLPINATYGMTETASQIATSSIDDEICKQGFAAKPLPYREIRIEDEHGIPIATSKIGQIAVSGKVVFKGYISSNCDDSDQTWFQTGDYGYLDENGYLVCVGRADDLIISGGENIYPMEIERVACDFPGVNFCAVFGIENKKWGERPVLFVEQDEKPFDVKQFQNYLEQQLPKLHVPDKVFALAKLPRTTIGKVDKEKLKQWIRSQTC